MFFLNFLVDTSPFSESELVLQFQDFLETIDVKKKKNRLLKKIFYLGTDTLGLLFRYSFPLKSVGALMRGKKIPLDCSFEAKFELKAENFDSNYLIGRINIKKGTLVMLGLSFKMEKTEEASAYLFSPTISTTKDSSVQKIQKFKKQINEYSNSIPSFRKKTFFSHCWSVSRISNAFSNYIFNHFIHIDKMIGLFKRESTNDFLETFWLSRVLKMSITQRFGIFIFRSLEKPFVFPYTLYKGTRETLQEGLKLFLYSVAFPVKNFYYPSTDILKIEFEAFPNLSKHLVNWVYQKKKEKNFYKGFVFPFSNRLSLSSRIKEQVGKEETVGKIKFSKNLEKGSLTKIFLLKQKETFWNQEMSYSELLINYLSRDIEKTKFYSECFSSKWILFFYMLVVFFQKNQDISYSWTSLLVNSKINKFDLLGRFLDEVFKTKGFDNLKLDYLIYKTKAKIVVKSIKGEGRNKLKIAFFFSKKKFWG